MTFSKEDFFRDPWQINGYWYRSTYIALIKEVRNITGRNENSEKINRDNHGNWLGAAGYMMAIDLLSDELPTASNINGTNLSNKQRYAYFLQTYGGLTFSDACILYEFRCAFIHDFGLQHNNNVFLATIEEDCPLIENIMNNIYQINLEKLGDLVEKIHSILSENSNYLNLNIRGELFIMN